MVVHDYTKVHLAKRNFAGEFKGNRVRASHTVGKAVEHVLQLCYNAVPGLFPKPVQSIRPTDWAAALMVALSCPHGQGPGLEVMLSSVREIELKLFPVLSVVKD
jgi:hypothetical protein